MQTIIAQAQPYGTTIVTAVIGVFVAVLLSGVGVIKAKAVTIWIVNLTRPNANYYIGSPLRPQTVYNDLDTEGKLQQALNYATEQLAYKGIKITPVEIRAVI